MSDEMVVRSPYDASEVGRVPRQGPVPTVGAMTDERLEVIQS